MDSPTRINTAASQNGWEALTPTHFGACARFIGPSGLELTVWYDEARRVRSAFLGKVRLTGGASVIVDLIQGVAR